MSFTNFASSLEICGKSQPNNLFGKTNMYQSAKRIFVGEAKCGVDFLPALLPLRDGYN
ncbi:hypothetical protein IQ247_04675 [Plectonema cf. radiosum LEGE 06105]|uniref:Uncharacterized protein n=1 Tax=Plectonema cf. radiosum LEGE 06105 TaxID=945769 RepID=A0A8J7F1L0_9CYAN|nr:hypothetical protein [Plectonema radiosum]MBE9212013.1 hypothetical protein [Plectonema cf. radiosum LEGE 06105]